jgi:hypothetical protein
MCNRSMEPTETPSTDVVTMPTMTRNAQRHVARQIARPSSLRDGDTVMQLPPSHTLFAPNLPYGEDRKTWPVLRGFIWMQVGPSHIIAPQRHGIALAKGADPAVSEEDLFLRIRVVPSNTPFVRTGVGAVSGTATDRERLGTPSAQDSTVWREFAARLLQVARREGFLHRDRLLRIRFQALRLLGVSATEKVTPLGTEQYGERKNLT